MTREEAIQLLELLVKFATLKESKECYELAIESLKQPEIIRCKGCHYYEDGHCDMHHMGVAPDDYCSYAVGKYGEDAT